MKTYNELMTLSTFEERFEYLKLDGKIGLETFGSERYLNQVLYMSPEWKSFRRSIILRDKGCDLAIEGLDIHDRATVHHINPITIEDVYNRDPKIFDPQNVITVSDDTHKGIHYHADSKNFIPVVPKERSRNDTCPWKKLGGQHGR